MSEPGRSIPDVLSDKRFSFTDAELERSLIFWCCVAGKGATQTERKVNEFLANLAREFAVKVHGFSQGPFDLIACAITYGKLWEHLRRVKMGKYALMERCFTALTRLNPRDCTLEQLEAVPGIGPKTARCFLLHSREGVRLAGLDTHILKAMRAWGYDAPVSTPTGRRYRELEVAFLAEADARAMAPADLDAQLWMHYTGRKDAYHLLEPSSVAIEARRERFMPGYKEALDRLAIVK